MWLDQVDQDIDLTLVKSQRVGERPPGSSSQPALLLTQTKF